MDLLNLILALVAITLFAVTAIGWGVDSREMSSDPRRPAYPVAISR